jgi:putative Mn2+ efflux pump MntP
MTISEIILLSVSLCFDTFAVSVSSGICLPQIPKLRFLRIVVIFAFIQGMMTFAGWLAGAGFSNYISSFDHWIAFVLLAYIGGKMIIEGTGREKGCECRDLRNFRILVIAAFATSIDAMAAGVSLACIGISAERILLTIAVIAIVTATAATTGLKGGRRIGNKVGKRSEIAGGAILILLGFKILAEHLNILY